MTRKVDVALDADVYERARQAAQAAGLPLDVWMDRLAECDEADRTAMFERGKAALAEYTAIYGAPTEEEMAETRAELAAVGFYDPETPEEYANRMRALAWLRGASERPPDADRAR